MWEESPIIKARLPKVYQSALEGRAIQAKVMVSGYVRAGLVAHLSLQKREDQSALHSALHPSFDRAAKRFILAYRMPVRVAGLPDEYSTVTTTWSRLLLKA